jgi:HEAT repeat protein
MKLPSLIATALAAIVGNAVLAQNPVAPSAPESAVRDAALEEKLDVYVGLLKHGSVQQRREAVLALGRIRERANTAIPALRAALECEDTQLRVGVAEALWQADKDPAAITTLTALLKDKDWRVIQNAVEALARIGPGAKSAVPALLKALDESWVWEPISDEKPPPAGLRPAQAAWLLWRIEKHPAAMPALIKNRTHYRAYGYLGLIGPEAKAAVPVLAELLKAEDGWTRIHVAIALWRIDKHPAAVPTLIAGLNEKEPGRRLDAIEALGRIGPEAKEAVPALAEALNDEKDYVGQAAAEALGRIGVDAVPALLEALKGRDRVRIAAAEALWRINKHPAAVPALAEDLTYRTAPEGGYAAAVYVLGRIGAEAKAAVPALAEALKDKNVDRRVEVAVTLWKINKDPAVMPVLVDALKDVTANGHTRVSAAKALWQINKHPGAVPALVEVVKDVKVAAHMRISAAEALWQINKHPAAVLALIEVLKDKNVRPIAAEALWQINKHPAAVPALVEALQDRDNWISSPAARSLGRIGAEAKVAEAALVEALRDEDEGVRTSAAQSLKKLTPTQDPER